MKLLFPEYRKGQLCSYTGSEYDIDTDDYITEITDIQSFKEIADLLETHAEINELIEQVIFSCENAKVFKYYSLKKTEMQNRFILLTKDMPEITRDIYKKKIEPLYDEFQRLWHINSKYMVANKDEVINVIKTSDNDRRQAIINTYSKAKAEANKKYYLKKKAEFADLKPAKIPKNAEEKLAAKIEANKNYYLKNKIENIPAAKSVEELKEKKELLKAKKIIANKKYYLKQKELFKDIN
jgi:hypothetical protein